jgi:hypothetical protein
MFSVLLALPAYPVTAPAFAAPPEVSATRRVIPFSRPSIGEEEIDEVVRCLRSGSLPLFLALSDDDQDYVIDRVLDTRRARRR